MPWIFKAMKNSTIIAEDFTKSFLATFNFEESELNRFFTCVHIAKKFVYYLLDNISDVYAIYSSLWHLQLLSKLLEIYSCIKLKTTK